MSIDDLLDVASVIGIIRFIALVALFILIVMVLVNALIYFKNSIEVKEEQNEILAKILNEIAMDNDLKHSQQNSSPVPNAQRPTPAPVSNIQANQLLDSYIKNAEKKQK